MTFAVIVELNIFAPSIICGEFESSSEYPASVSTDSPALRAVEVPVVVIDGEVQAKEIPLLPLDDRLYVSKTGTEMAPAPSIKTLVPILTPPSVEAFAVGSEYVAPLIPCAPVAPWMPVPVIP
jgi:hypothetical protein